MNILELTPPGRLPTVVLDPGEWWSALAGSHTLHRWNANTAWWRTIVSPRIHGTWVERLRFLADGVDLSGSCRRASRGLDALTRAETYASAEAYGEAVASLADHVDLLNRVHPDLEITLDAGPRIRALNYAESRDLTSYSRGESFLAASVRKALIGAPHDLDLIVLRATSPEDLLTGMIAVRVLKDLHPRAHACLADHGYENFSLQAHIESLRATGALESAFDSIVISKDEKDVVVAGLAAALERGEAPRGFLRAAHVPLPPGRAPRPVAAPPTPVFAPEPVLWTRVSARRCYWSRCSFCVHNEKYETSAAPTAGDVGPALDRVEAALRTGYRTFLFSDEALSPTMLRALSRGILNRGLDLRWTCRSKLEKAHTRSLFDLMARSGCVETLFGLETTSPRVQKLMDKHVDGLDDGRVREILRDMDEAGIAVHLNLLANFPGDTLKEVEATVAFSIDVLSPLRNSTFVLNRFGLFPGAPVERDPERFGLSLEPPAGDMPFERTYRIRSEFEAATREIDARLPALRDRMLDALGHVPSPALSLYFGSGHGALFKSRKFHPFTREARV